MSEWIRQCKKCTHYVNVDASGVVLPTFSCNAWDCHFEPKDKRMSGKNHTYLRSLILEQYGSIRKFSQRIGLSESMVSHILHHRKQLCQWIAILFADSLNVTTDIIYAYLNKEISE